RAERDRRVVLVVADRQAEDKRQPERRENLFDDVLRGPLRDPDGALRLDVADDDPGGAVEQPDVPEMGDVAVEPVALELDLLENDDPAPVLGLASRPEGAAAHV